MSEENNKSKISNSYILEIIEEENSKKAKEIIQDESKENVNKILEELDFEDQYKFLKLLDINSVPHVLTSLSNESQGRILELLTDEWGLLIQIKTAIYTKNFKKARSIVNEFPDADIAELFSELDLQEKLTYLRLLKTDDAASIFSYLDDDIQTELAQSFTEEWGINLLQELQSDELVDVLETLPANVTSKILAYTPSHKRNELNKLLSYNDDEVGSIMSIDISSIPNTYTCEQALAKIRRDYNKNKKELVHYYYVIDGSMKLLGVLTLEDILFAESNQKIDDIYEPVAYVKTSDKKEFAAKIFSEQDMSVLPVVNDHERLIGMITSDDVIDVIQDEATVDMYKIAGIGKDATENEYIKTPWYKILKSRIIWPIILLIIATITQIVLQFVLYKTQIINSSNQEIINSTIITLSFAALIPILNSTSNNSGLQANISVSRALVLGEIDEKTYKKAFLKEFIVALFIGLILGLLNASRLGIYYSVQNNALRSIDLNIVKKYAFIILGSSLAIFISVLLANIIGVALPLILAKMKKDPSNASILVLNTITDIITTLITFGVTYGIIYYI
ncbi:Magnesium transporter mgtE [Mycoplasmopsis maculosa]|uniref:Magnesium transporter MgtE n=1 Tax=Mycoplasmopsis maculosa TaxID=114885 RepID=A0A449B3V7_9BACT|nr:magnesium transporter [Mycoplasmopsis maculosa]VEU75266.1 Magnesium transporter mgtE [Mycoplasmopsis maculosa]